MYFSFYNSLSLTNSRKIPLLWCSVGSGPPDTGFLVGLVLTILHFSIATRGGHMDVERSLYVKGHDSFGDHTEEGRCDACTYED